MNRINKKKKKKSCFTVYIFQTNENRKWQTMMELYTEPRLCVLTVIFVKRMLTFSIMHTYVCISVNKTKILLV